MRLNIDIKKIKGIGEKTANLFNKLGVYSVEDLLEYYPRTYIRYPELKMLSEVNNNELVALKLTVSTDFKWKKVRNLTIASGFGTDGIGSVSLTFFNSLYLKKMLIKGKTYVFYGNIKSSNSKYHMEHPAVISLDDYQLLNKSLQPLYHLTKGLSNKTVSKAVKACIEDDQYIYEYKEYLSEEILDFFNLKSKKEALYSIHFPKNELEYENARKRLSFDELLGFLLMIRSFKNVDEAKESSYKMIDTALANRFVEELPFKLTESQIRVIDEIKNDLTSGFVMNRLVQGDVGSGKTIIAFAAMIMCIDNGYQCALMAPTEVLAAQHYKNLSDFISKYNLPLKVALLTGSTKASLRKEIYSGINNGEYNCVIGTHALIQDKISFKNLGLVIADEQHRFGVRQRQALADKGGEPHVLIMSATPIPRTLSIVLYGDMHLSVNDSKPSDRLPIKNCVVGPEFRPKAYEFIVDQIRKGFQAYVICPMVEKVDELPDVNDVISYSETLKEKMPSDVRIGYLHGKMKNDIKEHIMNEFYAHNIDILVSTTVIEVGVDVPNATVMMVENAERFGLSQLHQLRGRIGRGKDQSYSIFINSGQDKNERLEILNKSNDGFYISNEDLRLRGAGDIFGIRQSGQIGFTIADIIKDSEMILKINEYLNELYTDKNANSSIIESLNNIKEESLNKFVDFKTI